VTNTLNNLELRPRARAGEPSYITLFWDYDTQWGGDRSRSTWGPRKYGHLDFENTDLLLEMLGENGVHGCFAVVGAAALPGPRPYHDPAQIRRIHRLGHEIASHSFRHEWLPALNRKTLRETLRTSKDVLEQCIGQEVTTFVPPFNQPFDCPSRLSFSFSERREVRKGRTDLPTLCSELQEAGYKLSRVSYRSARERIVDRLRGFRSERPARLENISGLSCLRLNTAGGFGLSVMDQVAKHFSSGGIWVLYAHPHSASEDGPQSFASFRRFLKQLSEWRTSGLVYCRRPSELLEIDHRTPTSEAGCGRPGEQRPAIHASRTVSSGSDSGSGR
jgi:hypothetical protein